MMQELSSILEAIEKEKGIPRQILLEALRSALLSACRKTFPKAEDMDIQIDLETANIKVLQGGKEVFHPDFGRIAAQTAKQVILQKIREAERETIFGDFSKKMGEIVVGSVHRVEPRSIVVNLGKAEGILPAREQSPADGYRQGDVIRAYVIEVKKAGRGPEIILSRAHENFVKRLFELEVPEIHDKIVEIKAAAREAGSRTKIAVISYDEKIDSVGSCVGMRGQRVKNVVREIGGEKIDIVRWSDNAEAYIRNALSPAELAEVKLSTKEKRAEILVTDDQLSLAIGKKGQNVRLASKLTGWQLDVRPLTERIPLRSIEGVGEKIESILREAGIHSVKDLLKLSAEDLQKIEGIGAKTAEKIVQSALKAVGKGKASSLDQANEESSQPETQTEESVQHQEKDAKPEASSEEGGDNESQ
ncbi:MAG: transcription termination/antitermination protein NusA [Candidatus Omnitrophica bacterium]|nr:transcription termination/antitermination protein NusA [Candidatus Omnitrophota bacterium]